MTAVIDGESCGITDWSPIALAINNDGHVVGQMNCIGATWAFAWYGEGEPVFLPMPSGTSECSASGISGDGVIVGWHVNEEAPEFGRLAFVYDGEATRVIGPVPEGGNRHFANSISKTGGVIVGAWGNSIVGNPAREGIIWQDGSHELLGFLYDPNSDTVDINSAGQATGWRGHGWSQEGTVAYIWDPRMRTLRDLGQLPGGRSTAAAAINDLGHVAGTATLPDPSPAGWVGHGFFYDGELVDLGVPETRERECTPLDGLCLLRIPVLVQSRSGPDPRETE